MSERIVFGVPYEPPLPEEQLPPKFLGNKEGRDISLDDPFQVFIVKETLDRIWAHIRNRPTVEQAGVLVGHPFITPDEKTTFVIISASAPIEPGQAGAAHIVLTPEGSAQARVVIESEYPGLRPVGWYHSHPGIGIFLSAADSVITRSIYNSDWHLAMVLDPHTGELGIFRGPQQERITGYLLLKELPGIVQAIAAYNRALEFERQEDWQAAFNALMWLQTITETDLPDFDMWRQRGGYRDVAARLQEVQGHIAQMIGASPPVQSQQTGYEGIATLYNKSYEYMIADEWEKALRVLQEVVNQAPDYRDVAFLIRLASVRLEKNPRARKKAIRQQRPRPNASPRRIPRFTLRRNRSRGT